MIRARIALICLTLTGTMAAPAVAQQSQETAERKVLAERVCPDGATTTVVLAGELITVEYFSAPHPDGTVSGYEDAYDLREAREAKAQFDALRCPEQR